MKKIVYILVFLILIPIIWQIAIVLLGGTSALILWCIEHPFLTGVLIFVIALVAIFFCMYNLKKNYSSLSSNSKSSFWQILTNVFLVFFTFWMGIFVQDIIASKNENINKKLISYEYIDRVRPGFKKVLYNDLIPNLSIYADIVDSCRQKLKNDSIKLLEDSSFSDTYKIDKARYSRASDNFKKYINEHTAEIVQISKLHDSIMGEYKYYLDGEMYDSISRMNRTRNIIIAIAELLEDSTKLCDNPYSVIVEVFNISDSTQAQETAYFENIVKSSYTRYSGGESGNSYNDVENARKLYHLTTSGEDPQFVVMSELIKYIIYDTRIMSGEMKKHIPSDKTMTAIKLILGEPIRTFIIFLALTFIVSAIIVMVISPRRFGPVVSKEAYDKLKQKCDDYDSMLRQKEILLNRKQKEFKDADLANRELKKEILERDKKINNLEDIIHE